MGPPKAESEGPCERAPKPIGVVWIVFGDEVTLISLPGKLEPAAGVAPALSGLQGRHVAIYA